MSSPIVITEPGVYDGMSDADYHADPVPGGSLSSTGARKLLPPSCPARFHHERTNPPPSRPEFDFGKAAHLEVLGAGPDIVVIDAADWRTKTAREQRDTAYAAGQVPLLAADYTQIQGMANAIRQHPLAAALLDPTTGSPEQSLFWRDPETGVWCRARTDWLRNKTTGRVIVVDYKTTDSADPGHIERAVRRYGYHQQDPWYLDGIKAVGLADDAGFVFIFQEKTAPYLVHPVELDADTRHAGRARNRRALEIYRQCAETGDWPSYTADDDISLISLPPYALREDQ